MIPEQLAATLVTVLPSPGASPGGFTYQRLVTIAWELVRILLLLGEAIAVGFIVFYGIRMVTARGNPEAFSEAKRNLIWAAVGVAVMFGAYTIVVSLRSAVETLGG
jgi:cell division protein FtsW (lipid II flippase)